MDPKERLSLDEILKHKWFQQIAQIKPLLVNDLPTEKDQFIFHMLNKVTPDVEKQINELLGITSNITKEIKPLSISRN